MNNPAKHRKPRLKKIQFEIHLTDHCNLNCQMCDHFSPLAEEYYLDLQDFQKQMERLSFLFHKEAQFIRLLGGEPLLHPDVVSFFPITRACFPETDIKLYTNGLLLPAQTDAFWEACTKYNIIIVITKYPVKFDYDKLQKTLEEKKIPFYYENPEPIKSSWHFPLDLNGTQNETISFKLCQMAGKCIFLKDNILYPCTVPGNIVHFNRYFGTGIPLSEQDGINIFETDSADEILDFLCTPIPFCKYCDTIHRRKGLEWKRTQKDIKEWT